MSFLFCNWVGYIAFQENAGAIQENAMAIWTDKAPSIEKERKEGYRGSKRGATWKEKWGEVGEKRWGERWERKERSRTPDNPWLHFALWSLLTLLFFSFLFFLELIVIVIELNFGYNINSCNSCSSLSSGDVPTEFHSSPPRQSQSIYKQFQE